MTKKVDSSAKNARRICTENPPKIITTHTRPRITSLEKLNIYSCIKLLKEKKIRRFVVVDILL
jgi:CBS domain-containing protein